jgi:arylsulfatase A-like enzyme
MRAASLLGVFLVAKAAVLAGREVPLSAWTPIAYLWQDVAVVLLFGVLDFRLRRPRINWVIYGAVVVYTALNVPIARVLSTPLTWPLLRAARGPLADSILTYLTWSNVAFAVLVVAVAACLPFLMRLIPSRLLGLAGAVVLSPFVVLGPAAVARVETFGLHRNVLAILVTTAFPRVVAEGMAGGERASPFPGGPAEDLSRFSGAAAGRNVVLILLESTAARYLRPYGSAEDPMPHLTELACHAILFENAYAVYPESIKGLFSVLCSTYPALDTAPELYERVHPPSLAEVLARAGYRTGLFHSGRFAYLGMESIVRDRGFQTLEDAGDIGGDKYSSFGVDDERFTVRRVLAWIDALPRNQRFFVTYLPIAGHHPYNTPEPGPFPGDEAIDRYRNALHHADAAVGELLRGLRDRGLDRNTLFVLHGDHGEGFGQHPGNFAHTLFIYEENVRVPYLIAAPGMVAEPVRPQRLASLIDTAPTILYLLGLPAPDAYQGRSLLVGPPRLALFFTDYSLALLGLRDDRWKAIYDVETGRSKLFDLWEDPGETHDLSERFAERVAVYREHLRRWSGSQRNLILGHTRP